MSAVNVIKNTDSEPTEKPLKLIVTIALFVLMLAARDVGGAAVNKYMFLLLTLVSVFILALDDVICLISFVMPLYVGLPGNYMTLIFLVRILCESRKLHIKANNLAFCILAGVYALCQGILTNHTSISELMFFPGMILIMFIFSLDEKIDQTRLTVSYATGVAALGLIMLIHTLQYFSFDELMLSENRLGLALSTVIKGDMLLNVDPNYYGLFTIAAISCGAKYINEFKEKNRLLILIILLAICISVCLIGLSRAFILVVAVWMVLYLLSQKRMKAVLITIVVFIIGCVLVFKLMPEVVDALTERFNDSSMATGNGRTELIAKFYEEWLESISSILFGVGVLKINVHCAPLQMLFGGGIVFSFLFVGYVLTLLKRNHKFSYQDKLSLAVVFIMISTVPALALVNIMYPLAFVGICINLEESYEKS